MPTAPTQSSDDNSTKVATTAFVKSVIDNISLTVDSSLSTTSTNPVQNKIITEEINNIKQSINSINAILEQLQNGTTTS